MVDINPFAYTITVQEIEDDGERIYEATIAELPDAADYAETFAEAYELAIETIQGAAELYSKSGRDFPEPRKRVDDFSGRITLRMPKTIHAKAYQLAETEGVSLNQLLVSVISEKIGYTAGADKISNYLDIAFGHTIKAMDIIDTLITDLDLGNETTSLSGNSSKVIHFPTQATG